MGAINVTIHIVIDDVDIDIDEAINRCTYRYNFVLHHCITPVTPQKQP